MECYYHPERDGTDVCAICGKSVCKECGLEIAGKIYCKDCLEKIVGVGLNSNAPESNEQAAPMQSEPARLNKQPADNTVYQPQEEVEPITPQHAMSQETSGVANNGISDDSPYNIKDNIEYSGGPESSRIQEPVSQAPQVAQTEIEQPKVEIPQQPAPQEDDGFIYPDHSYEPEPIAGQNLEDKYEKYLDDLYFDENEVPLTEQLAKDEAEYGSLTRKPYTPKEAAEPAAANDKKLKDMKEDKVKAEIEKELNEDGEKPIHNLNYQQEKEPIGIVDILLTIILIIVILVVLYYLIYLFFLNAVYPTFLDAVFALSNPQNVINNLLK